MSEHEMDEQRWLAEVGKALDEAGRVPRAVVDAGYAAWSWRTLDAELAELTYDSLSDDLAQVASRSPDAAAAHAMTFTSAALTIELDVDPDRVLGQLVPPRPGVVTATRRDGASTTQAVDDRGCFVIEPVPVGAFRLRVEGAPAVSTGWISL